jgi:PAS domain S-box-containing protein
MKVYPLLHSMTGNIAIGVALQIGLAMIKLALEKGTAHETVFLYAALGVLMCDPHVGRYDEGFQFAMLSYRLSTGAPLSDMSAYIYSVAAISIPYRQSSRTIASYLRKGLQVGLETGSHFAANHIGHQIVANMIYLGSPLEEALAECNNRMSFSKEYGNIFALKTLISQSLFLRSLMGSTVSISTFDTPEFSEEQFDLEITSVGYPALTCKYFIVKLQSRFFAGNYLEAIQLCPKIESALLPLTCNIEHVEYLYFKTLSLCQVYRQCRPEQKQEYLSIILEGQRKFRKMADSCPENFLNRFYLISAEINRLQDKHENAMVDYDLAIQAARDHGFIHNEAISYELASSFYELKGFRLIAATYLRHARACYLKWGALAKVKQLDDKHRALFEAFDSMSSRGEVIDSQQLDFLSIIKASQTISKEISVDKLIKTLFKAIFEVSNAQCGSLVLVEEGILSIRAQAKATGKLFELEILDREPLSPIEFPVSVLNYVKTTGEPVILADASSLSKFKSDLYFRQKQPKSVLCLPVTRQDQQVALIYLENNLVSHAFKEQSLMALRTLATQAAISLENAILYGQLEEYKNKLQAILDNTTAIIYLKDTQYKYILVNQQYETLLQKTRSEILHKQDKDLFDAEISSQMRRNDAKVLEYNSSVEVEEKIPSSGGVRTYLSLKFPLHDCDGKIYALCGILTDISDRKREESERILLLEQTKRALQIRDDFISVASHELRTPLTPLRLQIQMINRHLNRPVFEKMADKEKINKMIQVADSQMDRLNDLIDKLLDISRIRSGRFDVHLEEADISELLDRVVYQFRHECRKARCVIKAEIAPQIRGQVDSIRIEQVIANLISNAIKFGHGKPIEIALSANGDCATIFVKDNGIGISLGDQSRIFERFERAASTMNFGGMGLGLFISRQIIEEHQGKISVTSTLGEGATFTIEIPLKVK